MTTTPTPAEDRHEPGHYEIRIKGHLDNRWTARFAGLTIRLEDNGDTTLTGPVVDQAALHGWLRKVRDLGLPLISVIQVDRKQARTPDSDENTNHNRSMTDTST